jgi:hypothetical protein
VNAEAKWARQRAIVNGLKQLARELTRKGHLTGAPSDRPHIVCRSRTAAHATPDGGWHPYIVDDFTLIIPPRSKA